MTSRTEPVNVEVMEQQILEEHYHNDQKEIKAYLDILKDERFNGHSNFFKIMQILRNCNMPKNFIYAIAETRCSNPEKRCKQITDNYKYLELGKGCTFASLKFMAKEDAPTEYAKVIKKYSKSINKLFALGYTDDGVADIFYEYHTNDFIFDPSRTKAKGQWYTLNEYGIWELQLKPIELIKKFVIVRDDIIKKLNVIVEKAIFKADHDAKQIDKINKKQTDLIKKMMTVKCKKDICESLERYYAKTPEWNYIPYLVGFNNGVYDASKDEFRIAKPEEYINQTTNYNFKKLTETDKHYVKCLEILTSIHGPNLDFILTCVSIGLGGVNMLENILFHIGSGSNGKSLHADIMAGAFGGHAYKGVKSSFFEEDKNNNKEKAEPALLKFKGKRYIGSGEGKKQSVLDSALLKSLSGNDTQEARTLNSDAIIEFVLMALINLYSNYMPEIDGDDDGICRRIILYNYLYKFVDNPRQPHEKKLDNTIKSMIKTDEFRNATFNILSGYYQKFINDSCKLVIPEKIQRDTEAYLIKSAPIANFTKYRIQQLTEEIKPEKRTTLDQMYVVYKTTVEAPLLKTRFRTELEKKGYIFKQQKGVLKCSNGLLIDLEESDDNKTEDIEDNK